MAYLSFCFMSQPIAFLDGSLCSDTWRIKALATWLSFFTCREHAWCVVRVLFLGNSLALGMDKRENKSIRVFCEFYLHFTEK